MSFLFMNLTFYMSWAPVIYVSCYANLLLVMIWIIVFLSPVQGWYYLAVYLFTAASISCLKAAPPCFIVAKLNLHSQNLYCRSQMSCSRPNKTLTCQSSKYKNKESGINMMCIMFLPRSFQQREYFSVNENNLLNWFSYEQKRADKPVTAAIFCNNLFLH